MKKVILIACENFGLSFSGGSSATAYFAFQLKEYFSRIIVLCKNHDNYLEGEVEKYTYAGFDELPDLIKAYSDSETIGYGDFYIAKAFIGTGVPFYFHYHDNWPEMSNFVDDPQIAVSRTKDYHTIFENAEHTFSVSSQKIKFIRNATDNVSLIRNGLSQKVYKTEQLIFESDSSFKILMIGNLSDRKYRKAIDLFNLIEEKQINNLQIDIFGNPEDQAVFQQISKYAFINICGFKPQLSYNGYHLYLNTSLVENLSLAVVDAIANHTPVVSFDVGGTSEIISCDNGAVISQFDVELMLNSILEIKEGKKRFDFDSEKISDFDWKKSANKMYFIMNNQAN